MELYYAIINIIDYHALNRKKLSKEMTDALNALAYEGKHEISDIADANNAGADCTTWDELVTRFTQLFDSGERIR